MDALAWPQDFRPERTQLRAGCFAGRLAEARGLVTEHALKEDGDFQSVVSDAVGVHGHLSIGQWAVREHAVDLDGLVGIVMFYRACQFGHLHVCQWLAEHGFEPRKWVVMAGTNPNRWGFNEMDRGFEAAVKRRHWAIARWLVQGRPEHPWPAEVLAELIAQLEPCPGHVDARRADPLSGKAVTMCV